MSKRERFAVSLTGLGDAGWLVEAADPKDAVAIVRGTVPEAHECKPDEFMVWNAHNYKERYRLGFEFGPEWTRLDDAVSLPGDTADTALTHSGVLNIEDANSEEKLE